MANRTIADRIVAVVALCLSIFFLAMPLAGRGAEFDIRFSDGKVAISADKIRSYDWTTHTLTLAPGTGEALVAQLRETRSLVSGIPFAVAVREKTIYTGVFTSIVSSIPKQTPVIVVDEQMLDPKLGQDRIRIALGYPTPEFFRGADPRADSRVRDALKADGKLVGGLH